MAGYNPYNPYNLYPNMQWSSPQQTFNQPKSEIIKVNGKNGAEAFQLAPNSQALLLDETAPIAWLVQTDGAGYKTVSAFDLTPHEDKAVSTLKDIEARLAKVEKQLNEKSNTRSNSNTTKQQSLSLDK